MNNQYMPDLQSLRMVLDTMGGKVYKVIRQEVYDFNEFGRVVPIYTEQQIYGVLIKKAPTFTMQSEGLGDRVDAEYSFSVVYPDVLNLGDTIFNDDGEELRVMSQEGVLEFGGAVTYELVRKGTYDKMKDRNYMQYK